MSWRLQHSGAEKNQGGQKHLRFPAFHPEDIGARTQRHVRNSIPTLAFRLARVIAQILPRCPCCGRLKEGYFETQ